MKILFIFIVCFTSLNLPAVDLDLSSQTYQTQLVELYTSEGCSSCPPADKFFSGLKKSRGLWQDFIPVALHVNYWDYIGWKDDFALTNNSIRQRQHKFSGNINSVYTPGMLKAGKEWRAWRFTDVIKSPIQVGTLSLKISKNKLEANFPDTNQTYKLIIGLLGMNINSMVNSGENKGSFLRHDFVLLRQHTYVSKTGQWNVDVNKRFFESKHKNLAFVAWVETLDNPTPIQAIGTFL